MHLNRFGFQPNIEKTADENMKIVLKDKIAAAYFNECNNMAFHNLSKDQIATSKHNLTTLLGLGPKICLQKDRISFQITERMLSRFRKDIRTRWFIAKHEPEDEKPLRLYRKLDSWVPKEIERVVEGAIKRFEEALRLEFASLNRKKNSNLTIM